MRILNGLWRALLRRRWTGQFARKPCTHLHLVTAVAPASDRCEACVAHGDGWPALRVCLTCGHVGCCDESKNRHSLRHFEETGHPLVRPQDDPGPDWIWCRIDEALLDPVPDPNPDPNPDPVPGPPRRGPRD